MSTDYEQITREHIEGYGNWVGEYAPPLLADRYSDRTHFVYELLQNAEDALRWRSDREDGFRKDVSFELLDNGLSFRHYGLPFDEKHVRAICKIGKGTKDDDLTAIGKHGIGFKSVYAYTHHPEVHSGDEHFVIELFVRPRGIESRPVSIDETCFWLPFDHPEAPRADAHTEIADRLRKLGLKTLLFLRNIESISWKLDSAEHGHYLRDPRRSVADGVDRVTLFGQENDEEPLMEEWLVFNREVKHNGKPAGFVEVAFVMETDKNSGAQRVSPVSESPLVVFFPTERETHFGFLIQGPYRTTPSRDNIPKGDAWNQRLVLETADLAVDALRKLREMGLLNVSALETVAISPLRYAPESQAAMFRPVLDAILKALKTERLIPNSSGGHVAGKDARLARAGKLRSLLSPAQLQQATGSEGMVEWVAGEVTRDQTPNLHGFLVSQLGIREIDSEDFVRNISGEFLAQQTDEWIIQFYGFLRDVPAIAKRPWFREKPFVRLENGTQVTPFSLAGIPNAYLPTGGATGFPTVRRFVSQDESARAFLTDLGLKEPDPVDDVIQNILEPRYASEASEVPPQYEEDIGRIVAAYQTDSLASRRTQLVERLRGARWVRCKNAGDGQVSLKSPSSCYLPTQKLQTLFSGNPTIWFVDHSVPPLQGKQSQALLGVCGASECLKRIEIPCKLSWDELRDIRRNSGLERYVRHSDRLSDYALDGLDALLERTSECTADEHGNLSLLLWTCIHDALRENREGFLYAEYSWRYAQETKRVPFAASFVRLLRSTPWLLIDNELKSPSQVCFRQLPEAFQENASHVLIELLEFKPDEIRQLAEKTGIEEEALDLLRQLNLGSAKELRKRLGLQDETAPPVPPAKRPQRTHYHTYISVRDSEPSHERDETQEQRRALEDEAIGLILREDGERFAEIRRMPTNNEGYDLEAVNENGEVVRYIEVKALRCAWHERPATLSSPQFELAQRESDRFWLYVVENAGQPDAKIHRIQAPARRAKYFTYDDGWRALAENDDQAHSEGDRE
jgi:hypothetical protein